MDAAAQRPRRFKTRKMTLQRAQHLAAELGVHIIINQDVDHPIREYIISRGSTTRSISRAFSAADLMAKCKDVVIEFATFPWTMDGDPEFVSVAQFSDESHLLRVPAAPLALETPWYACGVLNLVAQGNRIALEFVQRLMPRQRVQVAPRSGNGRLALLYIKKLFDSKRVRRKGVSENALVEVTAPPSNGVFCPDEILQSVLKPFLLLNKIKVREPKQDFEADITQQLLDTHYPDGVFRKFRDRGAAVLEFDSKNCITVKWTCKHTMLYLPVLSYKFKNVYSRQIEAGMDLDVGADDSLPFII